MRTTNPASTLFPNQNIVELSERPEELLLICFYDPNGISTVPETVAYIQKLSKFSITIINLFEQKEDKKNSGLLKLPANLNIQRFSGLIVHNSISYNVDNLYSLDTLLNLKFKDYDGIKILMKQDENNRFQELAKYVGQVQFDLVFTCLPESAISRIYPSELVGPTKFVRMYTGYVTPTLRKLGYIDIDIDRKIDVGYRGSIQPLSFGRLAYEKRKIGDDVYRLLKAKKFNVDISSKWEDRLGADLWFDFLGSCKATLGVESGASIFDLDGKLNKRCREIELELGKFRLDANYAETYLDKLSDYEDNVSYKQISPRHFEAAATGTLQLMFPGDYSGVFEAGRHYIALKRDYSNLSDVMAIVNDETKRKTITERAYEEIICNSDFWIETFICRFDKEVEQLLYSKALKQESLFKISNKNVLLLAAHETVLDPRIDWISSNSPQDISIHKLGISSNKTNSSIANEKFITTEAKRVKFSEDILRELYRECSHTSAGWAGLQELQFIAQSLKLEKLEFCEMFGAPVGDLYNLSSRNQKFRWYLNYILDTSMTLIKAAKRMRGFHAVIAVDLVTLPAALILKGLFSTPIIYDAHEFWSESDPLSFEFEKQFWVTLERRLVTQVDYCQTVTPSLANIMTNLYGVPFHHVPNCEPLASAQTTRVNNRRTSDCIFLFQGNFAPHRGIDLLINVWSDSNSDAVLALRGPDNDYKKLMISLAKEKGSNKRIIFPPAVDVKDLVNMAHRDGDIGILPYTPFGKNYQNCCPNKMSQYMAAGLPILANKTFFVEQIIQLSKSGLVVDFSKKNELLDAINELTSNHIARKNMANASKEYFNNEFHWEKVSQNFYNKIKAITLLDKKSSFMIYRDTKIEPLLISKDPDLCRKKIIKMQFLTREVLIFIWHIFPSRLKFYLSRFSFIAKLKEKLAKRL